jgi:hypothetical protein
MLIPQGDEGLHHGETAPSNSIVCGISWHLGGKRNTRIQESPERDTNTTERTSMVALEQLLVHIIASAFFLVDTATSPDSLQNVLASPEATRAYCHAQRYWSNVTSKIAALGFALGQPEDTCPCFLMSF